MNMAFLQQCVFMSAVLQFSCLKISNDKGDESHTGRVPNKEFNFIVEEGQDMVSDVLEHVYNTQIEGASDESWFSPDFVPVRYNNFSLFDDIQSLAKVTEKKPMTILIYGSSIDRNSVVDACQARGTNFSRKKKFSGASCKIGKTTLIWALNPGSGKPPHWDQEYLKNFEGLQVNSIEKYVTGHVKELVTEKASLNGSPVVPDLIVFESSLWDLAKWTTTGENKDGKVAETTLQRWCKTDIPEEINVLKNTWPTSNLVLRTPPMIETPGYRGNGGSAENDNLALNYMYGCMVMDLGKKYDVIDYHAVMDEYIKQHGIKGAFPKGDAKYGGYHPNHEADVLFINEVLNYAASH
eukprot:gnl/MRDRNA2_/MRDRNA2_93293_c0_seq1.p1 gnl/MRDRNA2_/MRDRNA2_93293_c0~~gnl/MRDRNA2_/MRDRNA2_93293_c0_seq1.p1  ORF type:complete len:352 (+),score=45.54 gnl/MRDRNA2_/MRDRNA2_93293_c0_seq1:113-1168(+)